MYTVTQTHLLRQIHMEEHRCLSCHYLEWQHVTINILEGYADTVFCYNPINYK